MGAGSAAASEAPRDAVPRPCVISGAGEVSVQEGDRRSERPPFTVYSERTTQRQIAVVRQPSAVRATWTRLPDAAEPTAARARLAVAGLQFSGWATLRGRLFQLRERAEIAPDRLWVRRGAPVEVLGVRGPLVVARVDTPARMLDAPKQLEVATACGNLAYEPVRAPADPQDAAPNGSGTAEPVAGILDLHQAPDGPRIVRLDLAASTWTSYSWMGTQGDWVRVSGGDTNIAFDAWVPAWQVRNPNGGRGISLGSIGGRSCCGLSDARWGRARRDALVRVGASPTGAPIGTLGAATKVIVEAAANGFQSFRLPLGQVVAPEGTRFWVPSDDVELISEAT